MIEILLMSGLLSAITTSGLYVFFGGPVAKHRKNL